MCFFLGIYSTFSSSANCFTKSSQRMVSEIQLRLRFKGPTSTIFSMIVPRFLTYKRETFLLFPQVKIVPSNNLGIINNAGIVSAGPLMDINTNDLIDQFNVNLIGIHRITSTFFPLILESKGRIIMISSNSGFFAAPFFGPYSASKFALEGYSDSLRRELLLYDVKVIIIQPGRINTAIWSKGEELLNKFKGSIFEKEAVVIGKHEIEKGKTDSLDPIEVAKIILKALIIKKPKNRYMIVPDMFRNKLLKILSSKRIDNILRKELYKIKNKKN